MIGSGEARSAGTRLLRFLAAVAGFGMFAFAPGASAADLSGRYDPYEDPRYADIYRDPPPRYAAPPPLRYAEPPPRYVAPPPSYKDDPPRERYGRLPPPRDERRYAERHPDDDIWGRRGERCVPKTIVRDRLERDGWHDFHAAEPDGPYALVNARDETGRLYSLRIDRCSGEIVDAQALEARRGRPFAWRAPRFERYRF